MRPIFVPELLDEEDPLVAEPEVGSDVGVTTIVLMTVSTPAVPDETLVISEVTGLADEEAAAEDLVEDAGAEVRDGEPPDADPSARPVMEASVG